MFWPSHLIFQIRNVLPVVKTPKDLYSSMHFNKKKKIAKPLLNLPLVLQPWCFKMKPVDFCASK